MKSILSARVAGNLLIGCLILLVGIHLLILMKVVPYEIVWGGQIKNSSDLVIFEVIALLLTAVFFLVVLIKIGYIKSEKFKKSANIGAWLLFAYFLLNTIGNFASGVSTETFIFAPLTILMTLFVLRIAIDK